jgi:hypothetical protein
LYVVYFHDGHTIEEHCRTIGEDLKDVTCQKNMYYVYCNLEEDLLRRIRKDPKVKEVQQCTHKELEDIKGANRSPITHYNSVSDWIDCPGWTVTFHAPEGYTIEKHFTRIGQRIPIASTWGHIGYETHEELSDAQMQAIYSDPYVYCIQRPVDLREGIDPWD